MTTVLRPALANSADPVERRSRRLLVVCTANVCRSPVVAGLLAARLGERWVVTSAGVSAIAAVADRPTLDVARGAGVDLSGHRSRRLDRQVLADDGADLVVTMSRAHLRAVVAIDAAAWPRTFTLKELARRSTSVAAARGESFEAWRTRIATGRRASGMVGPDVDDDTADPYGGPRDGYAAMLDEARRCIDVLERTGPWRR
jgi:protein-tyrosine phosphatase